MAPPPAMTIGRSEALMRSTARSSEAGSTGGRRTCHTRLRNISTGKSKASAWTSWGIARTTAPVSAGSVSARIACMSEGSSCSGRLMRSKNALTGRNASLHVVSRVWAFSICWRTGSG